MNLTLPGRDGGPGISGQDNGKEGHRVFSLEVGKWLGVAGVECMSEGWMGAVGGES